MIPLKIIFNSDHTEAEFVMHGGNIKGDEIVYYKYTKAMENNGKVFAMQMSQIRKLESMKLLITE